MTSEFTHYTGCRGDVENCSACALTVPKDRPNYAGWPLAYLQNGIRIPTKYRAALLEELDSDNLAYVKNLIRKLCVGGYDIEALRKSIR